MSLGFSPWGFLHLQIILKLLCSPELTSWGEARVTTSQVKARLSSPLNWLLTPQGNQLLCAIGGMSDYLSIRLCPQNLPGMADVLWKLEPPLRELFKLHVVFAYSSFYTACLFNQSLVLYKVEFTEDTLFNPLLFSSRSQALRGFLKILRDNCAMCHLTTHPYLSSCSKSVLSTVLSSNTFV